MELESMINPAAKTPLGVRIGGWLTAIFVIAVLAVHFGLLLWDGAVTYESEPVDNYTDFWFLSWVSDL